MATGDEDRRLIVPGGTVTKGWVTDDNKMEYKGDRFTVEVEEQKILTPGSVGKTEHVKINNELDNKGARLPAPKVDQVSECEVRSELLNTTTECDSNDGDADTSGIELGGSPFNSTVRSLRLDHLEPSSLTKSERRRKIGHRRVASDGQVTYKHVFASRIISSIQLGVEYAIGRMISAPQRDLLMQDFMTVETIVFSSSGSDVTPAHDYSPFVFKTYAPVAFKHFRELFEINHRGFLESFCKKSLKELAASGKSGSIFYITDDDRFIVKTMLNKECSFLQALLPGYYMNLHQNPNTLLPKYFGLYCYKCDLKKKIKLVTMNNILPSSIIINQTYDLKGATYKSRATKEILDNSLPITFKDLDFMSHHPKGFFLESETYDSLMKTIEKDCTVLESFKIMDYSLLLGVSKIDNWRAVPPKVYKKLYQSSMIADDVDSGWEESTTVGTSCCTTSRNSESSSDWLESHSTGHFSDKNRRQLDFLHARLTLDRTHQKLGDNRSEANVDDLFPQGGIPALNGDGEPVLIFIGIIDILQSYKIKKKLEHALKSIIQDGNTVSVHKPSYYSMRFQKFILEKVFKPYTPSAKRKNTRRIGKKTPLIDMKQQNSENRSVVREECSKSLPTITPVSSALKTSPATPIETGKT